MTDFNHSFREKVPVLDKYNYLTFNDLERCPYALFGRDGQGDKLIEWIKNDDHRMLLNALDKYADELQGKSIFKPGDKVQFVWEVYNIATGEITLVRKYESKVLEDAPLYGYNWYPNNKLKRIEE